MNHHATGLVPALIGQTLGDYCLDKHIGAGGFGLVFQANHTTSGADAAVKVLPPLGNPRAAVEFDTEGVLLRKLNKCDSVINLIDTGSTDISVTMNGLAVSIPFKWHALSLASGALNELTRDPIRLASWDWPERMSLWRGAVKGVHQMHLKNVAHRDIKAENCLLMVSGSRAEVRMADLGRSKDYSVGATLPPEAYLRGMGDRRFAPPEFLWVQGGHTAIDHRAADIYGLGSLLAEIATGHPITALALSSAQAAAIQGEMDAQAGVRRDLATLRPQFQRAVTEVADHLPVSIRHDATVLLAQLCDPVPLGRFPKKRARRKQVPEHGLDWLIRRADIFIKRLLIEQKQSTRTSKSERSIS